MVWSGVVMLLILLASLDAAAFTQKQQARCFFNAEAQRGRRNAEGGGGRVSFLAPILRVTLVFPLRLCVEMQFSGLIDITAGRGWRAGLLPGGGWLPVRCRPGGRGSSAAGPFWGWWRSVGGGGRGNPSTAW